LAMCKGFGETSCRGSPLGCPGDAIDIGVLGGRGMGCRGARGESGTLPGNALNPRGDKGGEIDELVEPGFLGNGEVCLSIGLGLTGKPGLNRGGDIGPEEISEDLDDASMPASDPALESDEARKSTGGAIGIVCRGLKGIVSLAENLSSLGVFGVRDFDLMLFFDRLRNSASFIAAISLSLSSSSLVFRRPRSVKAGISSTSKISS
jgi:hypothetical protein